MKTGIQLLFLFAIVFFTGCEEAANPYSQARIVSADAAACACCGGYFILVDQGTQQATYRFFQSDLPAGSTILNNPSYPVYVDLIYEAKNNFCNGIDGITISEIIKK